ncbi:outer membrane lipoprotein-sorting protein [Burkholderia sp. Ac-20379]|uniref:outer membrane lipoprotein-sorting protein n=1 Tax=Burkholderia sp. Ac-20379 TaxID=2703900 RepID=UPI0019814F52|nr:outer membrane lipoprotein-sorting protein [Burkholderia sp. Ac-20379]MBN3723228.1 outer membrane lipoprotein-sorting protein [Burkholderia sp. Ac-20379]
MLSFSAGRRTFGAALLAVCGIAHAAPDAQRLLADSDAVRNPSEPFSLNVTLTQYTDGKQTDANALTAYSRINPVSGQFRSLIRFAAPARDANKLMLKTGSDLWFFDPASKASIRISPQQRLLGQASNGDVVTVNFAHGYRASFEAEEDIQDGDRQKRQAYRLKLEASAPDMTYHAIEMWLDATDSRPIKARFYSESGKLLKTAFYRRYQPQLGATRPTEIVIIDGLNPNLVTVMRYGEFKARAIPDAWFQQDYLPQFQPE